MSSSFQEVYIYSNKREKELGVNGTTPDEGYYY